ncbi:Bug family tripartite tricarboxylate transporter substrate binding protein [Cupriavidus necator]
MKKILGVLMIMVCACVLVPMAKAQVSTWPNKPIRLVIPFPPGGGTDTLSRLVANALTQTTTWTFVPDNRPGAGGTIGIAEVAKASPTGYELVTGQRDNVAVAPWLYKSVTYDPRRDLMAIAHMAIVPLVIVVPASSPFQNINELIASAKRAPETIKYGSPGSGTTAHLAAEMISGAAGSKLLHVPYKGSNAALVDTIAGNVDMMISSVPSVMAQIRAGTVRALAVTSSIRSTSLPNVPTVAESGFQQVDISTWYGLFAPAKTPKVIVDRINAEVNRILAQPSVIQAIHEQGAEVRPMSVPQFSRFVESDYLKWKEVVKTLGAALE